MARLLTGRTPAGASGGTRGPLPPNRTPQHHHTGHTPCGKRPYAPPLHPPNSPPAPCETHEQHPPPRPCLPRSTLYSPTRQQPQPPQNVNSTATYISFDSTAKNRSDSSPDKKLSRKAKKHAHLTTHTRVPQSLNLPHHHPHPPSNPHHHHLPTRKATNPHRPTNSVWSESSATAHRKLTRRGHPRRRKRQTPLSDL